MRMNRLTAAILALSCAILTASCIQSSAATREAGDTDESASASELEDDGDPFGGDPDLGAGIGSEPPTSPVGRDPGSSGFGSWPSSPGSPVEREPGEPGEEESAGDGVRLVACVALGVAPAKARGVFCDTLCDRGAYARCRSHLFHSRIEWTNWCHFEFDD
jgi:hypothetical protein